MPRFRDGIIRFAVAPRHLTGPPRDGISFPTEHRLSPRHAHFTCSDQSAFPVSSQAEHTDVPVSKTRRADRPLHSGAAS